MNLDLSPAEFRVMQALVAYADKPMNWIADNVLCVSHSLIQFHLNSIVKKNNIEGGNRRLIATLTYLQMERHSQLSRSRHQRYLTQFIATSPNYRDLSKLCEIWEIAPLYAEYDIDYKATYELLAAVAIELDNNIDKRYLTDLDDTTYQQWVTSDNE